MSILVRREDTTVFDFRPWGLLKRLKMACRVIVKPHFQITHTTIEVPMDGRTEMISRGTG